LPHALAQSEAEIEGLPTVKALDDLADPSVTGISVITPPRVTLEILKRAKERQVPALWLQPGAEDAAVADFVRVRCLLLRHKSRSKLSRSQDNGMSDRVILGGPCILVLGEGLLSDAKRPKSSL
jgi:hypothetical protein